MQEGLNIFELIATDAATNSRRLDVRLTLDTVPPVAVDTVMMEVDDAAEGQVRVSGGAGSVEAGASVTITNTRTGQTVSVRANSEGGFEITIAAQVGDILSIVIVDVAGNASPPSTVEVESALPPDPSSSRSPLRSYRRHRFCHCDRLPLQRQPPNPDRDCPRDDRAPSRVGATRSGADTVMGRRWRG